MEKENNIGSDILIEKIKSGIEKAIKKDYPYCENIRVDIDPVTGKLDIRILKEVMDVMYVDDPDNEIFLDEAKVYDPNIKVGDMVEIPLDPAKFGRVAAQNAKQSIKHDIKDFERARLIEQYHDKEHECVSATVQKVEPATQNAILTIDKNEVYLVRNEQIPGETLKAGDIVKVYVVGIANPDRKPSIKISRTHRELVKRLFEQEVPEIFDGVVEIKSVSREAGSRTKMAVVSKNPDIDAVGACIGTKGARVNSIVDELGGEKIDIIEYSDDPQKYISAALSPAKVLSVEITDLENKNCRVTVPDGQLSLAIGNKGQNARLAARLTGWKIDIRPESGFFGEDEEDEKLEVAEDTTAEDTLELDDTAEENTEALDLDGEKTAEADVEADENTNEE